MVGEGLWGLIFGISRGKFETGTLSILQKCLPCKNFKHLSLLVLSLLWWERVCGVLFLGFQEENLKQGL